ncbi:carbamoyltransferase family protein [Pusillimonas noertemannii]|uniref:Carbamoyltransferase n=1 Tax=Pusillimonas noertemannii TaxID=305977 RepID=A0A2U1CLB5_9BURK|nr:carbamoyltransferase C-terminal domain-containing protein [Pusillimonas noertemannii]NYT69331.1 carbamoyltransferase [Pusillimonas noertemannii]PVY61797.1 carbamoyltransferase [Pusillimonas noertemannii]TFL09731.1 carbamoyltransferase [Pusillimonas noertemannii]
MYTLGINAAFHDCSAALVRDGTVLAAAEEERFTRIKHGKRPVPFSAWQLPYHAIDYCLAEAGCRLAEVDHIAYAFDPRLLTSEMAAEGEFTLPLEPSARPTNKGSPWEPLFLSYIVNAPRQLKDGVPHHLQDRFRGVTLERILERWHFVEHHLAHEASAFLASPFEDAAVLTMDGRGERASTSYGHFRAGHYDRLKQINLPHSLGLLYEDVTRYLGFLHSSDEYKVMALASYGRPVHVEEFRHIVQTDGHGGYRLEPSHLERRFGPGRERGESFDESHMDIAHSLQQVLEETVLEMAGWLHEATNADNLCMAGGVALNCVMNARLADEGPFRNVWVQPAAGDAGTSLGAALWVDFHARESGLRKWVMDHAYLGPGYGNEEIEAFLERSGIRYRRLDDVAGAAAGLLAQEKVLGWFQGRMEFGPRALGARSILASPRDARMQGRLNELKDREDFRPVAPVVLQEKAHEWFDSRGRDRITAPFMLFVYDVLPERAAQIPAVRHTDGTARVQTVESRQHPLLHRLLCEFDALTGVPVLVNTSFNTRGEPVVCSVRDALECFWTSPLDALVIGDYLVEKPS